MENSIKKMQNDASVKGITAIQFRNIFQGKKKGRHLISL